MTILETEDIKYNLIELIGSGATCEVYKGHPMENSSALFAIKIFKERNRNFFEKETFIHEILNNSNYFLPLKKAGSGYIHRTPEESIFTYMNEEETLEKVFYEIEELAENGELFNYVYDIGKGFNEEICAKIFYDILKSVELLHKKGIVHCDIKPENILIGNDFKPKLIDFGFSQKIRDENNYIIDSSSGSDIYCAPEIRKVHIQGYNGIKSDIFSLGVLLFVIKVGKFPFSVSGYCDKRYRLIMHKKFDEYWNGFKNDKLSDEFKDLMNHLVCYDPSERFDIKEILEHPWIKKNVYDLENNKDINIDKEVIYELQDRKKNMKCNRT